MSKITALITRCPQCATAFRVTTEALKVANGSVRCGSCLSVFNAHIHAVNNIDSRASANAALASNTAKHHVSDNTFVDENKTVGPVDNEQWDQAFNDPTALIQPKNESFDDKQVDSLLIDIITNDLQDAQQNTTTNITPTASVPTSEQHHQKIDSLDVDVDVDIDIDIDIDIDSILLDDITLDILALDEQPIKPRRWPWAIGAIS
ncbi:MAG: putative Zn finger-like uncharacterized protein, partial [Kiritimatiellia bacterium]